MRVYIKGMKMPKVDEFELWCNGFCSPARLVRKDDFCSYGSKYED